MEVAPPWLYPATEVAVLVRRMVRIGRPAVNPDVALVTVCFQLFLAGAVTVLAQRL